LVFYINFCNSLPISLSFLAESGCEYGKNNDVKYPKVHTAATNNIKTKGGLERNQL